MRGVRCETCLYWSDLVAEQTGNGPLMALCENPVGEKKSRMTSGKDRCPQWEPSR